MMLAVFFLCVNSHAKASYGTELFCPFSEFFAQLNQDVSSVITSRFNRPLNRWRCWILKITRRLFKLGVLIITKQLHFSHAPILLFPSPQKCNTALAQDLVIEDQSGRLIRHAKTHVQGQQMLLTRVAVACGRRLLPFDQALFTLGVG